MSIVDTHSRIFPPDAEVETFTIRGRINNLQPKHIYSEFLPYPNNNLGSKNVQSIDKLKLSRARNSH